MTHPTLKVIAGFFILIAVLAVGTTFGMPSRRAELAKLSTILKRPLFSPSTASIASKFGYLSRNESTDDLVLEAEAALVWDITEGRALYAKGSTIRRPIASITKLVTAAVVMDVTSPTDLVRITDSAVSVNGEAGNLRPGETLSVGDLLNALLLESSNDAATALAEHVERSTQIDFVSLMNEKAHALGLLNSSFRDPAGLVDEGAFSTAEDLARLLSHLRINPTYGPLWEILSRPEVDALSEDGLLYHEFVNNNPFLEELAGVIGGKTGYTTLAGESMVLLTKSPDNSRELAYILLGSPDRFAEMRELINWAQSAYIWEKLPIK